MALTFTTGNTFSNGDSATSTKLNNMVNLATYAGQLEVAAGGSGAATLTAHGVIFGQGTSAFTACVAGTSGAPLLSGGASADGAYGALNLAGGSSIVTGITPTANGGTGIAYFTAAGPSTARIYTFPDAACTILTTNAAVTIGQGGTGKATSNLARNAINQGATALSDGASIATDASLDNVFTVTLGGNRTLANPTNLQSGATYIWIVSQDGTGSRTLAYGNKFKWPAGSAPVLTTTASAVDVITAVYNGTNLLCSALLNLS